MRISLRNFERVAAATKTSAGESRKGFVLVEVIVAMVLLGVAVSSLAALMYSVSQSGMKATGDAYRNGVLMQEVNRLEGVPYDSIPVAVTSILVPTAPYKHTKKISVTQPVANVIKSITIVITPPDTKLKPDTATFLRTKSRTSKVLCTDCPQG
jgi:prepilin-type N-terminal cleavage/methylation domain-containing protein